jgi:transposase
MGKFYTVNRLQSALCNRALVMDNARFHHATEIIQLVDQHGCKILYLPPYSPESNPIEQAWVPLKNRVRKSLRDGVDDLHQAIINSLT